MPILTMMSLLNLFTVFAVGLLVGSEVCLTAFTNPVLLKLDEPARIKAAHLLASKLAIPLPPWNVLCLLLFITNAVLRRHEPSLPFLIASCVLWAAAAAFTLILMLPLNTRLARLDANAPSKQAVSDYTYWAKRHLPRLCLLTAAFLSFLFANYF